LSQATKDKSYIEYKKYDIIEVTKNRFFPVLSLEMVIRDGLLKFKESQEYIKSEMRSYLRSLIQTFNYMQHPKTCKVNLEKNYDPQEREEVMRD
jgi:hypothetical protein